MFDLVLPLARYDEPQTCGCGNMAIKQLSAPRFFIPQDICYDSPIDGRPITSMQARIDDLKRANCVPWEPGIAQDGERRAKEEEVKLDRAVDETVEKEFSRMSPDKKAKLANEIMGGAEIETVRITPQQQSFKEVL